MEISLEKKAFVLHDDGRASKILRSDLIEIIELIRKEVKSAAIILGGSLAYDEGRFFEQNGKIKFLSDFDIFLVVPSLIQVLKAWKNPKLKNLPESLGLSNSVELIFVWERLLSLGLTTVAGEILIENRRVIKILKNLPVPRATNNLKRAYKYLLWGFINLDKEGEYIGRAMIQGLQALLMVLRRDAKYEVWNNFFSLRYLLGEIDSVKNLLEDSIYSLLKETLEDFLDIEKKARYEIKDFFLVRDFLNKVYLMSKPTFEINDYIRYISFHMKKGRIPNPFINSTRYYLDSTRLLLDAVLGLDKFDEKKLKEGECILNKFTGEKDKGENAEDILKKSIEKLKKYDEVYLHKVKQKINLTPLCF